ncbi:MAG: hypothetical protein ACK5O2_00830 [Microthrixaceae bacterium]
MPEISANPRLVRHLTITIGTDSFSKHVNNCTFTPTASQTEWRGGTPDAVFTDSPPASWACALTLVQDWETAASLCNFLLAHDGEQAEFVYKPQADGAVSFETIATIVAPVIGGAVGVYNESTVTMPCERPELVRAP